MTEGDGSTSVMLPQEARLRNLTYSSPLYLEMTKKVSVAVERPVPLNELDDEQETEMGSRSRRGRGQDVRMYRVGRGVTNLCILRRLGMEQDCLEQKDWVCCILVAFIRSTH